MSEAQQIGLSEFKLSRRHVALALLIGASTIILLALIFSSRVSWLTPLSSSDIVLVNGQVSPIDVLAPTRITFPSQIQTAQAQDQAAKTVADIYDPPNSEVARQQVRLAARVLDFLDTLRADPYSTRAEKVDWLTSIPTTTVSTSVVSRTLALESTQYHQVISETLYVLDQAMRDEIRQGDLDKARARLGSLVSLVLSAEQSDLVAQWAGSFLIPNTTFDEVKTSAARASARQAVGVVYRTIEKGEAIVRTGEVITPETMEALQASGYLQPQNRSQEPAAGLLYSTLLVVIGGLYLARFAPQLFAQPRVLLVISLLWVGMAIGAKIVSQGQSIIPYLFPFAAAGMLGAALLDAELGIGLAVLVALTVGFISRGAVDLTVYSLVGGLFGVLTLRQRDRLTAFIISGLYVALANIAVVLLFGLLARELDLSELSRQAVAAAGSGALAGLIVLGSQFVLGRFAGLTTALELIELSRPTHPLLQRLLRDAPGTYHHSLIISNLAEHAAQRVGADSLLVRVGAYYHDVGKTLNPQFYAENQFEGINVHDSLEPRASVAILQQHVLDGLNLTRKYSVSERVRDLIPQHHGTTVATYFYDKALRQAGEDQVDINNFRYPGPKPQTREAAIMMLADGVEATTRAERPSTPDQVRAIIDQIVDQRVREKQLDEAAVTLQDLERIKEAFFEVLQGLYHPRVKYPNPPQLRVTPQTLPRSALIEQDDH